jgi:hypothetical protein
LPDVTRVRVSADDLKDINPESELYKRAKSDLDEFPAGAAYREYARERLQDDGELEFDYDAVVSLSGEPGAYVMAWVWIDEEELREEGYLPANDAAENAEGADGSAS